MAKKIIWTPEAELSFECVIEYLKEKWSDKETRKFIVKVNEVVQHISSHPLAYRSAGKEDVREAVITSHNILLYRITKDAIYILYIWDTRRNPANKPV